MLASASSAPIAAPDDPRLEGWYHTIELGGGIVTKGVFDHRPILDRFGLPASLAGKSALDVGTGDGFFAFELERRGAERVTAIDVPTLDDIDWTPTMRSRLAPDFLAGQPWRDRFQLAHATLRSRVEYRPLSVSGTSS